MLLFQVTREPAGQSVALQPTRRPVHTSCVPVIVSAGDHSEENFPDAVNPAGLPTTETSSEHRSWVIWAPSAPLTDQCPLIRGQVKPGGGGGLGGGGGGAGSHPPHLVLKSGQQFL
jgi:hypothetical protein